MIFRHEEFSNRLELRKGKCKKCGKCCVIMKIGNIDIFCPFNRNKKCLIYKNRPYFFCKLPPVTLEDYFCHKKYNCGYYWGD